MGFLLMGRERPKPQARNALVVNRTVSVDVKGVADGETRSRQGKFCSTGRATHI